MKKQDDIPLLELKNINKSFGGLNATQNMVLSIQKGETVSVIGPNGAGKTTLLNLISGLIPITSGEIWFKGQRIDKLAAHQISVLGIARTFQNLQLFSNMSVLEECTGRM